MATKNVKETVETVKTEAKEAAKKLSKKAEPAVEAAKTTIKTVSEKAEPAVKKATGAAKNATDAAVAAGKKAATKLMSEVYVEFGGTKFDCSNIVERCKDDFKAKHNGQRVRSCRVYIKPEDGMAYYVINEMADKLSL